MAQRPFQRRGVPRPGKNRPEVLATIASGAERAANERQAGYREQSLRIHPLVCARCGRSFSRDSLTELTVHHRDHNHENNPPDGSNWENLCVYCHDDEHRRYEEHVARGGPSGGVGKEVVEAATHSPFANLRAMLESGGGEGRGGKSG
ncbi:MAG: HNH nuclease family protein [Magnetococcales bacterium]|nr:HNH nuclease family protein [Magnetococcales bacterium]MBF0155594.1 HNH nuclease family protein [Magnetococcales bacterium]